MIRSMTRPRLFLASAASTVCMIALGVAPQAIAAAPTPAHWTLAGLPNPPISPGATFVVKLSAQIEPGWHIYAMEEPDGGPIPTEIGLADGDPLILLKVDEPTPRMVLDPVLRHAVGMYQNESSFILHLRCPRKLLAGSTSHLLVRYQSCNDQVCLPPHTETVAFPLDSLVK